MLKDSDNKAKKLTIVTALIYIIFGLLLIIFPVQMQNLVTILLGVASLVIGIVKLILYFTKDKNEAAYNYDLVLGIIFSALGVLVLIFQGQVLQILPVIFGIFILISSLIKVQNAVDIKRLGGAKWWVPLILAMISIVLAIILILKPGFVVNATFIFIGIFMVIDGIGGIASILMYTKTFSKAKKAVDNAASDLSGETVDADSAEVISSVPVVNPNTASDTASSAESFASDAASSAASAAEKAEAPHLNFDPDTGKPLKK